MHDRIDESSVFGVRHSSPTNTSSVARPCGVATRITRRRAPPASASSCSASWASVRSPGSTASAGRFFVAAKSMSCGVATAGYVATVRPEGAFAISEANPHPVCAFASQRRTCSAADTLVQARGRDAQAETLGAIGIDDNNPARSRSEAGFGRRGVLMRGSYRIPARLAGANRRQPIPEIGLGRERGQSELARRPVSQLHARSTGLRHSVDFVRECWWALQGLNLRLIPCEGITLPLS